MQVYQAAGSGLENHNLIHNVIGIAKFSYASGGFTAGSNNFGFGTSSASAADGFVTFTWNTKFGTVPPNVHIRMARRDSTAAAMADVMGVGSASCAAMFYLLTHAQLTATKAVGASIMTAGETASGTIWLTPYSASGTVFTFA